MPLKNRESCGARDFIPEFHETPQAVLRSTQDKKPTLPKPGPPAGHSALQQRVPSFRDDFDLPGGRSFLGSQRGGESSFFRNELVGHGTEEKPKPRLRKPKRVGRPERLNHSLNVHVPEWNYPIGRIRHREKREKVGRAPVSLLGLAAKFVRNVRRSPFRPRAAIFLVCFSGQRVQMDLHRARIADCLIGGLATHVANAP